MSEPEKIVWKDVEKAIKDVVSLLDETAKSAKTLETRALGENLAAAMRENSQELNAAYAQLNATIGTEQAALESKIRQAMDEQQKAFDAAKKTFDALPKPPAPAQLVVPEAAPGPRLRRELLDRYGKRQAAKPGERPAGFDTWLGSSSVVPADSGTAPKPATPPKPPEPPDDLEQAWMPYFNKGTAPPPTQPTPPAPSATPTAPPKKPDAEPGKRGWVTWMDDSSSDS